VREFLAREFMARGLNVLLARNGQETLEVARNSAIDLLVLDADLPDTGGAVAIHSLRHSGWMIPALILAFSPEEAAECLRESSSQFVQKSEDVGPLMSAAHESLRFTSKNFDRTKQVL
jgi:DNA-binding response OmpR family regulator